MILFSDQFCSHWIVIGRNPSETHREHNPRTNYWHFQLLGQNHSTYLSRKMCNNDHHRRWPSDKPTKRICKQGSSQAVHSILHVRHSQSLHDVATRRSAEHTRRISPRSWVSQGQRCSTGYNSQVGFHCPERERLWLWPENLSANNGRCYGFIIHIDTGQYLHVEMAERTRPMARHHWWILRSVSVKLFESIQFVVILLYRYVDDIFLTWNRSERDLKQLLDKANQAHPNIKLDYEIGRSLPFLDVLVTNKQGVLSTSVYHKPTAEPYVLPFTSDHPRHVFRNIVRTKLTRAVRYSSTFEAFDHERRSIKLMLLYNGYAQMCFSLSNFSSCF